MQPATVHPAVSFSMEYEQSRFLAMVSRDAGVCLGPGIDAEGNRVNFRPECWNSWWIQLQNSEFSHSVHCSSIVFCVTSTEKSVLAFKALADLVSWRNERFLPNASGLQRRKGLQRHLRFIVIYLPCCSLGL